MSNLLQTQKIILITGCSSGFGLLFALRLSAAGHIVYATMRDVSARKELEAKLLERSLKAHIRQLNVVDVQSIQQVVEEIHKNHGRLDVLINNAGYGLAGFFEDLDDAEIRDQMDVNFFGVQNVTRAVLPLMRKERKGLIINISSIAGQTATPCLGAYNASKWALEGFSESLYYELRPFNVDVVLVEPGSYPTKIFGPNARFGKNFYNTKSAYFPYSSRLRAFVERMHGKNKRNPDDVARLVEHIINTQRPRLRYISDPSSWARVFFSKIFPPSFYMYIYRKIVYGKDIDTV